MTMFLGLDIGGTTIKAAVVDSDGAIVYRTSQPTGAEQGKESVLSTIRSTIEHTIAAHPSVVAVGIGVPGVVNPQDGCVYHPPNLPGWDVVPLASLVQSYTHIPVVVDNDANVAAVAELLLGAGRGHAHFLYVTLGTGVGGGIIANNQLFVGERGGAGEIGHIVIDAHVLPEHGQLPFRPGTLEEFVGRKGILRLATYYASQYPTSLLHTYTELDVQHISDAVERGDIAAQACFRQAGYYIGIGLASALVLLDMRTIVVGGGISQAHPLLLGTAQATLQERAFPTIANEVQVLQAHFGSDAGVVGAAMIGKLAVE